MNGCAAITAAAEPDALKKLRRVVLAFRGLAILGWPITIFSSRFERAVALSAWPHRTMREADSVELQFDRGMTTLNSVRSARRILKRIQ